MEQPSSKADRLLSTSDVVAITGWSRQHILREEKAGRFPKRIQMGPHTVKWSDLEVSRWIEAKKAQRQAA